MCAEHVYLSLRAEEWVGIGCVRPGGWRVSQVGPQAPPDQRTEGAKLDLKSYHVYVLVKNLENIS